MCEGVKDCACNAKDLSRDVQAGAAREDWCGVRRKFHINASVGGKGRKVPAAKRKRTSRHQLPQRMKLKS